MRVFRLVLRPMDASFPGAFSVQKYLPNFTEINLAPYPALRAERQFKGVAPCCNQVENEFSPKRAGSWDEPQLLCCSLPRCTRRTSPTLLLMVGAAGFTEAAVSTAAVSMAAVSMAAVSMA